MTLKNFLALTAITFGAFGLTSCDDDDEKTTSPSELAAGEYTGTNMMQTGGEATPEEGYTTQIIAQGNGLVSVMLPAKKDAQRGGMNLPPVLVKDVKLTSNGNNSYTLSADTIDVVTGQMHIVGKGLNGAIKGNELNLKYNIKPGKMPIYIDGTFQGKKQ